MDFIDQVPVIPLWLSITLIVAGISAMMAAMYLAIREKKRASHVLPFLLLFIVSVSSIVTVVSTGTQSPAARQVQRDAALDLMKTTYGVELSEEQFKELRYPNNPGMLSAEPRALGSTVILDGTEESGFARTEIFLVTVNDRLILADAEGEPLEPLKAR